MIQVKEVTSKKERKRFIQFQNDLYKGNKEYVPTLMMDEMANLDPKKNPAFEYCDMRFFLAEKEGRPVGRIGAILSHKANALWDQKQMRITRLDFVEDIAVLQALLEPVKRWAKETGMEEIVGPIGFCDLDKEGMLVEGFEKPGMFITYYNYPYYKTLMEEYGFEKDVDWVEQQVYLDSTNEKLARLSERIMKKQHFSVVDLKSKRKVKPYIEKVFNLVNSEYEGLYGVVPLTERQVEYYVGQFLTLVNMRYISLIVSEDDQLVAMGVCAPSLAEAMRKTGGRLFPFGWATLLRALKKPSILDMYLVAVKEEYRKSGLSLVLMHEVYRRAKEDNIVLAETGPQLESNLAVQNMWDYFRVERNVRRRRSWKLKV